MMARTTRDSSRDVQRRSALSYPGDMSNATETFSNIGSGEDSERLCAVLWILPWPPAAVMQLAWTEGHSLAGCLEKLDLAGAQLPRIGGARCGNPRRLPRPRHLAGSGPGPWRGWVACCVLPPAGISAGSSVADRKVCPSYQSTSPSLPQSRFAFISIQS